MVNSKSINRMKHFYCNIFTIDITHTYIRWMFQFCCQLHFLSSLLLLHPFISKKKKKKTFRGLSIFAYLSSQTHSGPGKGSRWRTRLLTEWGLSPVSRITQSPRVSTLGSIELISSNVKHWCFEITVTTQCMSMEAYGWGTLCYRGLPNVFTPAPSYPHPRAWLRLCTPFKTQRNIITSMILWYSGPRY